MHAHFFASEPLTTILSELRCRNGYRALPPPSLTQMLRQKIRQRLDAGGARAAGWGDEMHRPFGLLPVPQDDLDLARLQHIADDEVRQVRDAEPGQQRRHQCLAIVDAQWPG